MPAAPCAAWAFGVFAVFAARHADGSRLLKHAANRPAQLLQAENATVVENSTAGAPSIVYNATAKLPVVAMHVAPKWETSKEEHDRKNQRPAAVPSGIIASIAGALGSAADQALAIQKAEESKRQSEEQRKKMEAIMRDKCANAEPGSALARRCAAGTYPGSPNKGAAPAEQIVAPAVAAPAPQQSAAPVKTEREKDFKTRAAEQFGSADDALKSADLDGDGQVSKEELEKFMTDKLGFTPEEARALSDELMKKYDPDGDGKLTSEQFKDLLRNLDHDDEKDLQARAAEKFGSAENSLKNADLDGDGQVSKEELEKFMTDKLGFTPEEARAMSDEIMKKYDPDGDGKLTSEQFQHALGGKTGGAHGASALAALALAFLVHASLA